MTAQSPQRKGGFRLYTANRAFGQLVNANNATNALPSLVNIDPPRMFQLQLRFLS